jgi:hypothetical protein
VPGLERVRDEAVLIRVTHQPGVGRAAALELPILFGGGKGVEAGRAAEIEIERQAGPMGRAMRREGIDAAAIGAPGGFFRRTAVGGRDAQERGRKGGLLAGRRTAGRTWIVFPPNASSGAAAANDGAGGDAGQPVFMAPTKGRRSCQRVARLDIAGASTAPVAARLCAACQSENALAKPAVSGAHVVAISRAMSGA